MTLSIEDLKNMANVVIESTNGPTQTGTGDQVNTTPDTPQGSANVTVVEGDNHGGIQFFSR
ncbi:hypothetical protein [Streptomyces sp. Mo3]|uniref:hypothetical protein n=1 Tax=Streptomyces sp. Mo3 TaxID=3161190 RepID=UPI0039F05F23